MISAGNHLGKAIEAELGIAGTGISQIGVNFVITEGVHEGEEITWYGYFTEKAFKWTIKQLRTAGWKGDDFEDFSSLETSDETVSLRIIHDEWEGNVSAKVDFINQAAGGVRIAQRLSPEEKKSFAEEMKGKLLALQAGTSQENSGDDIPF